MKPLTIDFVIENKMSHTDCILYFKPDATESEIEYIIWDETCYPFDDVLFVENVNFYFKDLITE